MALGSQPEFMGVRDVISELPKAPLDLLSPPLFLRRRAGERSQPGSCRAVRTRNLSTAVETGGSVGQRVEGRKTTEVVIVGSCHVPSTVLRLKKVFLHVFI